jgi:hypothetical protein
MLTSSELLVVMMMMMMMIHQLRHGRQDVVQATSALHFSKGLHLGDTWITSWQ